MRATGDDVKIAIGIPIFRSDAVVNFAIESALSQASSVTEIIIADNASNRSAETIQRWRRDARVRYINSGSNVGPLCNFIRCWEASNERYFIWLGDDDFLHPSLGESLREQISKSTEETVAWNFLPSTHSSCSGTSISGNEFHEIDGRTSVERIIQIQRCNRWNHFFYSVYDRNQISINSLKFFQAHWKSYSNPIDWAWTYSVAISGKMALVPEQLYFYRDDNWRDPIATYRREAMAFADFLKPGHSLTETLLLLAVNSSLLKLLFLVQHCHYLQSGLSNESEDTTTQRESQLFKSLIMTIGNIFTSSLINIAGSDRSKTALRLESLLKKPFEDKVVFAIADILNASLKPEYSIEEITNIVMLKGNSKHRQSTSNVFSQEKLGGIAIGKAAFRAASSLMLETVPLKKVLSKVKYRLITRRNTRVVYLPLEK